MVDTGLQGPGQLETFEQEETNNAPVIGTGGQGPEQEHVKPLFDLLTDIRSGKTMDWGAFRARLETHPEEAIPRPENLDGKKCVNQPTVLFLLLDGGRDSCRPHFRLPVDTLKSVIDACPDALQLSMYSELPLHTICLSLVHGKRFATVEHVVTVLEAYPDALKVQSWSGEPLHIILSVMGIGGVCRFGTKSYSRPS